MGRAACRLRPAQPSPIARTGMARALVPTAGDLLAGNLWRHAGELVRALSAPTRPVATTRQVHAAGRPLGEDHRIDALAAWERFSRELGRHPGACDPARARPAPPLHG